MSIDPPASSTVWDRSRRLASQGIVEAAIALFTEQGYDQTTIAQIAAAAGVSDRTLFRYFGTKEDILDVDGAPFAQLMRDAAEAEPADASAWDALRAAFLAVLAAHPSPEETLARMRLVFAVPALRARYAQKRLEWQVALLEPVQLRLRSSVADSELRARACIATSFACADIALAAWISLDGAGDIAALYDACIAAVREPS